MARSQLTDDVQETICRLIREGVTDKEAFTQAGISETTFYRWTAIGECVANRQNHDEMPKTKAAQERRREFWEAVTRARSDRKALLEKSVYEVATGQTKTQKVIVETFRETRLTRKGDPYEYVKTTERKEIGQLAPDYKASLEYLSRQYGADWLPAKQRIVFEQMDGTTRELLVRLLQKLEELDMPASSVFDAMLRKIDASVND